MAGGRVTRPAGPRRSLAQARAQARARARAQAQAQADDTTTKEVHHV